jgi:hypothetical protein
MGLSTSLDIYTAICRELGGGLERPSSEVFYSRFGCLMYSKLHAQSNLWAVQEPRSSNQAYNVVNGDTES